MTDVATGLPTVFYTYVTASVEPPQPEEGETWYDTAADESKVYDGAEWVVQNIESHAALSGINPDDHHQRYQDSEAESAAPVQSVNGQTGSVSVDQPTETAFGGSVTPWTDAVDKTGLIAGYRAVADANPNVESVMTLTVTNASGETFQDSVTVQPDTTAPLEVSPTGYVTSVTLDSDNSYGDLHSEEAKYRIVPEHKHSI